MIVLVTSLVRVFLFHIQEGTPNRTVYKQAFNTAAIMAGKRTKVQLTKDDTLSRYHDDKSSGDENEMDKPQMASEQVMATRKIAGLNRRFAKKASGLTAPKPAVDSMVTSASESNAPDSKLSQMKSLNANFLKSINDGILKNPVGDFSKICEKYIDYLNKVKNNLIKVDNLDTPKVNVTIPKIDEEKPKANPFAMFAKPAPVVSEPVVSKQPVLPAVNAKKAPVKSQSDSESDDDEPKVEIKGPSFKLDALPKANNGNYSFKFGFAPPKEEYSDSEDEIEIKGPSFKLGAPIKDAVFKMPSKTATTAQAPEKAEKTTQQPKFSFTPSKTADTATKQPNFGVTPTAETPKATASTGFTFGKPTEAPKPIAAPSTGFTFGKPAEAPSTDAKPTFNFGKTTAPAFTFGQNSAISSADGSAFKFGQNAASGSTPSASAFGQNASASSSTGFSFGSNTNNDNSANSTSKNTNVFSISKTNGFNSTDVSSSPAKSAFSFSAPAPKNDENQATVVPVIDEEAKELEKDTVKGNYAVVQLTKKVEVKSGEEDEQTLASKRSKVTKYDAASKSYKDVGLGELKVLKNVANNKARLLLRSEGSSNVLLNISILKDLKYEIMGEKKNMIRIPSINVNSELETFMARIKTSNDTEELLNAIKKCQESL